MEKFSGFEHIEAEFDKYDIAEGRAKFNKILSDAREVQDIASQDGSIKAGLDILQEQYGVTYVRDAIHVRVTGYMKMYDSDASHVYDISTGLRKMEGDCLEVYDEDVELGWVGFVSEGEDEEAEIKALCVRSNDDDYGGRFSWVSVDLDAEIVAPQHFDKDRVSILLEQYVSKTVESFDELVLNTSSEGDVTPACLLGLRNFDYSEILNLEDDIKKYAGYAFEIYAHNTIDFDRGMPYLLHFSGYYRGVDDDFWSSGMTSRPVMFKIDEITMIVGDDQPEGLALVGTIMGSDVTSDSEQRYIVPVNSLEKIYSSRDAICSWIEHNPARR